MTKKELEIQNELLIGQITDCGKRIQYNIELGVGHECLTMDGQPHSS